MPKKEQYREFCATETAVPIFSRAWWLDTLCGENNWDVCLIEKGGRIVASMPYSIQKKYGFTLVSQPPLTQTIGPWLRPSKKKYTKKLGEQKDLLQALIDQLPPFDYFSQNWHYSNTNWLPFRWRGFQQTTYYTYILPDLTNEHQLWAGLRENIRTDIRKAENRFNLHVRDDLGMEAFLPLNRMTFTRQGRRLPYPENVIRRLDTACRAHKCRKIFIAEDAEGRHHAGMYIVWDENSAYYLMGGGDPDLRNSGATSLCMWHGIRYAATVTKQFDFEGSMIEAVERFFRAFGAVQTPYFHITKINSPLLRLRQGIKQIVT